MHSFTSRAVTCPYPCAAIAAKHVVRPSDALCEAARFSEPNLSVRMSETTAAVLRPLLKNLPSRVLEYNRRYNIVSSTDTCGGTELERKSYPRDLF